MSDRNRNGAHFALYHPPTMKETLLHHPLTVILAAFWTVAGPLYASAALAQVAEDATVVSASLPPALSVGIGVIMCVGGAALMLATFWRGELGTHWLMERIALTLGGVASTCHILVALHTDESALSVLIGVTLAAMAAGRWTASLHSEQIYRGE